MAATLRTGNDDDVLPVAALHFRSRGAAYAHILSPETLATPSATALASWWGERRKWEQESHRLTVAEDFDRIIGFSYVGPSETEGAAELYAIHVDPAMVGTGVGRLLMANALTELAEIGGERAVLWVLAANERARRFYHQVGWSPDGETRVAPVSGEPVEQLRYSRPLG
jgi:ribosomal protein S18 acetylase RimI-like enzyme